MTTRRDFVRLGAVAAAAAGLRVGAAASAREAVTGSPLRLLVLGGTGFFGPHLVEHALSRGHEVTLFNRGATNPGLFPEVEKLRGDREKGDLTALEGRTWDAVVDSSAVLPRWTRESARALRGAVGQYVFISCLSVYADTSRPGIDELAPVARLRDPANETVTATTFGPLKAAAEAAIRAEFGASSTMLRSGLLTGPGDPTDRFTYWPVRIDRGGAVLAPGSPSDPIQLIDVRDVAGFVVAAIEATTSGVFNLVGPLAPMSIAEMLYGIRATTAADIRFIWVRTDFLQEQEVSPWTDLPVWVPPRDGLEGFARFSNHRAVAAGLEFRPLADTARDTLAWFQGLPDTRRAQLRAGLTAAREAEVLARWRRRRDLQAPSVTA
jgi:2'-hydroxyisoflavone reductase